MSITHARDSRSSALEKALSVLEAVSDQPQAVGLPDLAARLGLPRQTVHRVLGQLETLKLIIRDRSRERYSVGPRLSKLGFVTLRSLNQSTPIRLILQRPRRRHRRDLQRRRPRRSPLRLSAAHRVPMAAAPAPGYRHAHEPRTPSPAARCCSPTSTPALSRRMLKAHKLKAATPHTLTSLADLEAEFARIRAAGFALNNQERVEGIVGVAVPVLQPRRRGAGRRGHAGPHAAPHHQGLRAPRAPPEAGRGADRPRLVRLTRRRVLVQASSAAIASRRRGARPCAGGDRHLGKAGGVDPVALQPLRQGEEIGIADRVGLAHHPGPFEHLALDQVEALADRLRHLPLHLLDGRRIVDPAIAAQRCAWATWTVEHR